MLELCSLLFCQGYELMLGFWLKTKRGCMYALRFGWGIVYVPVWVCFLTVLVFVFVFKINNSERNMKENSENLSKRCS